MRKSTVYGLAGIAALSLLALVQWFRDPAVARSPVAEYLLGVGPNFAAAIAILFVLLSIWADQNRQAGFAEARRPFLACAAISAVGLAAWEVFQRTSDRFVFDLHDLGATVLGIGVSAILFVVLNRTRSPSKPRVDDQTR